MTILTRHGDDDIEGVAKALDKDDLFSGTLNYVFRSYSGQWSVYSLDHEIHFTPLLFNLYSGDVVRKVIICTCHDILVFSKLKLVAALVSAQLHNVSRSCLSVS